ncbi:hypothetical protein GS584_23190 [Rhodococcus hoagii]|nr:hypothetical protein [Prescottella equi]
MTTHLRRGRIVGLLAERDVTGTGVPVTFFGEATRMRRAGAAGARHRCAPATGQLLVHTDGWGFHVGPPIDTSGGLQPTTQAMISRFAAGIAAHPADWHMLPTGVDRRHPGRSVARGMHCASTYFVDGYSDSKHRCSALRDCAILSSHAAHCSHCG